MTAKEMFEELGYKYEKVVDTIIYSQNFGYSKIEIRFNLGLRLVEFEADKDIRFTFEVNEIQAINQQCKELGWLE